MHFKVYEMRLHTPRVTMLIDVDGDWKKDDEYSGFEMRIVRIHPKEYSLNE